MRIAAWIGAWVLLSLCGAQAICADASARRTLAPDDFYRVQDVTDPQVSPDGQWIAYLAPDEKDVLQVWLRPTAAASEQKLTADPKRGIRSFFWTYLPDQLVYLQDKDGDENFHL